ncbi:hypothetical protein CRN63_06415 [Vibrio vulnificus]|nr:hypothetical protein CRN46_09590 [Vibrio vulnificus]POF53807.1 hypothetical protein CRN63_06415 [Vibrio vulnificus]
MGIGMNNTRLTLLALSIGVIAGCNSGSSSHSGSGGQVDSKGVYRSVCQENLGSSDKGLTFTVEGSVAKLTGIVCSGSPAAFERMMKENQQVKTLNFVTVGGSINDDANLELAYKVRNKRLDSLINSNGLIASGGTDLFIAGVQRTIETGAKIGVHSWATEDDDGKEIQGADLPKDHPDHQGYIRYYRAMGLAQPSEFYFFTLEKAPSDGMHYMTEAELTTYQVGSVTTKPDSGLSSAIDRQMFQQIAQAYELIDEQNLWPNYATYYKTMPQYLLRVDASESPISAFILNPPTLADSMQPLGSVESANLRAYRDDSNMHLAQDKLKAGNGTYDFDYAFQGGKFYLQQVSDNDMKSEVSPVNSTIGLNVHENFHQYQFTHFQRPASYIQDLANYPVNQPLIELKLLTLALFSDLPATLTDEQLLGKLVQYVALTEKQIASDPSAAKLVRHMGLGQELYEGSAYYVETLLSREMFGDEHHFPFVHPSMLTRSYANAKEVRDDFGFGVFYHTGASAIWLLHSLGYDLAEFEKGVYPFDAAKKMVGNEINMEQVVAAMYADPDNKALLQRAKTIADLL